MFPTSSSTDRVGTNARSATALINSLSLPRALPVRRSPGAEAYPWPGRQPTGNRRADRDSLICSRSLSARTTRTGRATAGVVAALMLTSCGGLEAPRGASGGSFPVSASASFPPAQRLAQTASFRVTVRNAGARALPDVAVTICNVTCAYPAPPGEGTQAAAFATDIAPLPSLADPSRPVWIITRAPGLCGYGCAGGAQGGAATAYSNTWAFGRLEPGRTATFEWAVSAVRPGRHTVAWQVAPALAGAVVARGTLTVEISTAPARYRVNADGQVVESR